MDRVLTRIRVAEVMRPLMRLVPRGHDRLYKMIVGDYVGTSRSDAELKKRLRRRFCVFRDRHIGASIAVDLGDWSCRAHYFKGIYHDRLVPKLLDMHLGSGGTFIDIGANRGIHTLYACRLLNGKGHVYAFEPNPHTFEVLEDHLAMNQVGNCSVFRMGLGSASGEMSLHAFMDDHSGTCSFVEHSDIQDSFPVSVGRMDDVLEHADLSGRRLVKIDAEGFEYEILMGMEAALALEELVVVCEVTDRWLRMAGTSADALFDFMASRGFIRYGVSVGYRGLISERLELQPMTAPPSVWQYDVVFARAGVLLPGN